MTEEKRTNWGKWVGLGCVGMLLVSALVSWAAYSLFMSALWKNDAFRGAMERLRADASAVAALGEPIEPGFLPTGEINVSGPSGDAAWSIPVHGPRGKGTLYLVATKRAGPWEYSLLELAVTGQEQRIDLLPGE